MFLLVPAYPGSPGPTAVKRLCVCACVCVCVVPYNVRTPDRCESPLYGQTNQSDGLTVVRVGGNGETTVGRCDHAVVAVTD